MMRYLFLLCCMAAVFNSQSQTYEPFTGKLVYRIELYNPMDETTTFQSRSTVYTNDTLVRVESETVQLGSQLLIRHLVLQKYYLLLELNNRKFAIQQHMPSDTVPSRYTFRKKWGHKRIAGQKAKRVIVSAETFDHPREMWYLKKTSPKYTDAIPGIPGLPVDYWVQTEDGYLHYILESLERSPVNKDLFGIPSDFQRVSFEEFMEQMMQEQN